MKTTNEFVDFNEEARNSYCDATGWENTQPKIAYLDGFEIIAYSEAIDLIATTDRFDISDYWRLNTNLAAYPTLILANRFYDDFSEAEDREDMIKILRTYGFESIDD